MTARIQLKQRNQLPLHQQDDCKTRKNTKNYMYITKLKHAQLEQQYTMSNNNRITAIGLTTVEATGVRIYILLAKHVRWILLFKNRLPHLCNNKIQNLREELLNTVTTYCQPTLNVLLYGNANLSESENKTIFSAVQEFILKTKRF